MTKNFFLVVCSRIFCLLLNSTRLSSSAKYTTKQTYIWGKRIRELSQIFTTSSSVVVQTSIAVKDIRIFFEVKGAMILAKYWGKQSIKIQYKSLVTEKKKGTESNKKPGQNGGWRNLLYARTKYLNRMESTTYRTTLSISLFQWKNGSSKICPFPVI